MQHHAVVFESQTSVQFRVFGEFVLIDLAAFDEFGNPFVKLVRLFHITFVQFEVHLERFIRNSLQVAQVELSCCVSNRAHYHLPEFIPCAHDARAYPSLILLSRENVANEWRGLVNSVARKKEEHDASCPS